MSSSFQTFIALGLVTLAVAYLLRGWLRKKKQPGCGSAGECGAISPEVKQLQARLKR